MRRFRHNPHRAAWHTKWHQSMHRRLFFVLLFTGMISVVLWAIGHHVSLQIQFVYAYSTALFIWVLTDPVRQRLFPSDTLAWSRSWKVWCYIAFCIILGFVLGTAVGDWYAGWSTLDLLRFAPQKLAGLVVMCVSISTAFIVFFYQQNRLQVVEKQATESKLQLLQSQLEPHMLFNTLANLRVLIDLDSVRAQAMLDRIIDYLRATLGASRVTQHALSLEFDRLDDYLALMKIRMGHRLNYSLHLPDDLGKQSCPSLLLQPVVENAVLHGIEPCASGGEITVTASQDKQNLILTVIDTGMGIALGEDEQTLHEESNSGFGLTQLRERLEVLYPARASLTITPIEPQGTCVTILMPINASINETNFCPYC